MKNPFTARPQPLPTKLPQPDQWGNYWLRSENRLQSAAIFPSTQIVGRRRKSDDDDDSKYETVRTGKFFACDDNLDALTDGPGLRYFDTPEEALGFLRNRL